MTKRPWTGPQVLHSYKASPLCGEHVTDDKGGHCDEGRRGWTDDGFCPCHQAPCTYNSKTQTFLHFIHI